MHQQYGTKLFVVDYLQLLHSTSPRAESGINPLSETYTRFESAAKVNDEDVPN